MFDNVQLTLFYYGALSMNIVHPEMSTMCSITFLQCVRCSENVLLSSLCGWVALLVTAGVMGEGVGEFNVNSLNRSLHASNICAISFPITLDSSRLPPPFHAGREYITHLPQIFVFTVCISQHPFMNVLIIGGSS